GVPVAAADQPRVAGPDDDRPALGRDALEHVAGVGQRLLGGAQREVDRRLARAGRAAGVAARALPVAPPAAAAGARAAPPEEVARGGGRGGGMATRAARTLSHRCSAVGPWEVTAPRPQIRTRRSVSVGIGDQRREAPSRYMASATHWPSTPRASASAESTCAV